MFAHVYAWAADLHVFTPGDAKATAFSEPAFETLDAARDAIRAMKANTGLPAGGVTVWIHGGVREMAEPFRLSAEDSGEDGRPIIYRAAEGETVTLSGGRALPADAFTPVTDAETLARLDAAAHGHILLADLAQLGITNLGEYPAQFIEPPVIPELFFDGVRMTLAQWPNDGWATVEKVIESGSAPWRNYASDKLGVFEYSGERPSRWTKAPAVWLHGYWCFDWQSDTTQVSSIDIEKRRITFAHPHVYGLGSGNPAPRRYRAVNLLEELDAASEYFIDREKKLLYFWPPRPVSEGRTVLSTLAVPLIQIESASHVTLQGFTIETSEDTAITISGGRENCLASCVVRNMGRDGIVVDGGEKHSVVACDIYDTGQAGLRISGGDRKTLTPSGHEVINNHIYNVSRRQRTHAYHLHLGGVGIHVAHNLLHDGPHQAIIVAGNDHLIEFNEIHHVGMDSDDCGAFYMGRNPSERGTVLQYNFWRDIGSSFAHGSSAVYFDDGAGGQRVFGNVFLRAAGGSFGAVFVHGGHDNLVENNIFIECKMAFRQVPWNDAMWQEWLKGELWQKALLTDVDITKPPYSERYPDLAGYFDVPGKPRVNHARRNVVYNCNAVSDGDWELTSNWETKEDPGFKDAASGNYALKDDAAAFRSIEGFKSIPFEKIGLYRDALRPKLPNNSH